MQVLGIDPSLTCTGIATVGQTRLVAANRFPTKAAKTLEGTQARVRYIVGSVLRWAPSNGLLTVIERPYVPQGQGGAGSLIERAWLYGLLVDQLLQRGPVVEVRPTIRAKYAAGAGNANKKTVLAAIRQAYPALPVRDDNEADAIALAAMGARFLGYPIDGEQPSAKQAEAMAAVLWPVIEKREN